MIGTTLIATMMMTIAMMSVTGMMLEKMAMRNGYVNATVIIILQLLIITPLINQILNTIPFVQELSIPNGLKNVAIIKARHMVRAMEVRHMDLVMEARHKAQVMEVRHMEQVMEVAFIMAALIAMTGMTLIVMMMTTTALKIVTRMTLVKMEMKNGFVSVPFPIIPQYTIPLLIQTLTPTRLINLVTPMALPIHRIHLKPLIKVHLLKSKLQSTQMAPLRPMVRSAGEL